MERFVYEESLIGAGSFGKVRRGRDTVLERDIAIKTLDPLLAKFTEPEQERFRREARVLARLSHPNIPAIYDVDFSPGRLSIIFQFVEGQNLRKIIEREEATQIGTAKGWFQQITSALDHAHQLGVIHRDIKPENVIITNDLESAYLVDFGIALTSEEARRLTRTGYVIGTPGYMSPEQERGEILDGRSDIYTLAIVLYEVLAGKKIAIGAYEPLSINEAIPPAIDDLIQDCLLPKERRISSARMFISRLNQAVSQSIKPLSDILAHGRLHELAAFLEGLEASELASLPLGQRNLIMAKVTTIVASNEYQLQSASERFLELMLTRGVLLGKEEYREIVEPAIQWAFAREFGGGRIGRETLRKSLQDASFVARGEAYDVLREEMLKFLQGLVFDDKEDWYLHVLRQVIESLMANPSCTEGARELGEAYRKITRIQRSRPWRAAAARAADR